MSRGNISVIPWTIECYIIHGNTNVTVLGPKTVMLGENSPNEPQGLHWGSCLDEVLEAAMHVYSMAHLDSLRLNISSRLGYTRCCFSIDIIYCFYSPNKSVIMDNTHLCIVDGTMEAGQPCNTCTVS